jgi:hypothetical protein
MAFFEDVFKGGTIGTGLAVGVGMAVVAPVVAPVIGGILRPVVKTAVKAGLVAYDAGREGLARINEASGDIVGEAWAEMERDRKAAAGETGTRAERRTAG